MKPRWLRPIRSWRVIDGDSIEVDVDLGFNVFHRVAIRLANIDAPELGDARQHTAAAICAGAISAWMESKAKEGLVAETYELDKYGGRWIGEIIYGSEPTPRRITSWILNKGYARQYGGGKKEEWSDDELSYIVAKGVPAESDL